MFDQLGRFTYRRRWWVLAAGVLLIATGVLWGAGVFSNLTGGGIGSDPNSEFVRAQDKVAAELGRQGPDVVALYTSTTRTVDDPQYRSGVEAALQRLPTSAVTSTSTYWSTGSPVFLSKDRMSTFAALQLVGDTDDARQDSFAAVEDQLRRAPPHTTVQLGGLVAMGADISSQVESDIKTAESVSLPMVLLLLILVFGGVVAAGLPLAIGVLAILGSFTVIRLITLITDVSVYTINIVTMLGLGLAIDYALFVVSRFRDEMRAGHDVEPALITTMRTAGRTVAISGLTVSISLSSLLLFPQLFLHSMAFGGVSAVLIAMIGSLTVLPALLAIVGGRIDRWRIPMHRAVHAKHRRTIPGFWYRVAHSVMRRPVRYVVVIVPVLLVLAVPFTSVRFGTVDERALPVGTESRSVAEQLAQDFPSATVQDSIFAVVTLNEPVTSTAGKQQLSQYQDRLAGVPGVTGTDVEKAAGDTALFSVHHHFDPQSGQAEHLVTAVRAVPPPAGAQALVGGTTAELVDLLSSLGSRLPWMALWMVLATLVLLFMAFGSVVLPVKAVLMNLLSLTASFGAIVWIFQDGHLSSALGFTVTGTVDSAQPILMLAIAFGLSMDYEVFLLSRIRESWDSGLDNTSAVAHGLQNTGRIITSAALLLVVVFAAFATSGITFVKMIGVGMVLAIVIDATIVRTLLVPSSMQLLGQANWWAPAPLGRFWARFGMREGGAPRTRVRAAAAPGRHFSPATHRADDPARRADSDPTGHVPQLVARPGRMSDH